MTGGDPRWSTTGDGIAPAALIGLFGKGIMAGLTRNSDRAAAAAGAVADQRTRTLALAAAVVVSRQRSGWHGSSSPSSATT